MALLKEMIEEIATDEASAAGEQYLSTHVRGRDGSWLIAHRFRVRGSGFNVKQVKGKR